MLHVCGIVKSFITMKIIFSLSYENKMAFFYLSANFLAMVVSASSVQTSKGIIFLSLQWYSCSFSLYFPDVYIVF